MDDYYPGPNTGLVVCDRDGRILASGRGVFELTGFGEGELMGHDVVEAASGSPGSTDDKNPVSLALEWGVRRLGEQLQLRTKAGVAEAGDRRPVPRLRRRRRTAGRAQPAGSAGEPAHLLARLGLDEARAQQRAGRRLVVGQRLGPHLLYPGLRERPLGQPTIASDA